MFMNEPDHSGKKLMKLTQLPLSANLCLVTVMLLLLAGPGHALNDPMRPPFFDGSGNKENPVVNRPLLLSMILTAAERRVAVLNGQSVQVGDEVDGYRVLRIERQKVVVSHKGKVKEVFLGAPQQQKTRVSNQSMVVED